MLQEISRILSHPNVYEFLHIPVQSGSDSVLLEMKREYGSTEFRRICDFILNRSLSHFPCLLDDHHYDAPFRSFTTKLLNLKNTTRHEHLTVLIPYSQTPIHHPGNGHNLRLPDGDRRGL